MDIRINTKTVLNEISPLFYGAFFEDINYGGDGGLYAELIANRSFEYYDAGGATDKHKMCWEPISDASFEIRTERPINDIHRHYARVSGGSGCGIRNAGYGSEGFAADTDGTFLFSCYARADKSTPIAAVIADGSGKILGSDGFECCGGEWHKYELEITTVAKCRNAYLSIMLPDGGAADIELISLFPKDTFKGRRNGMRRDIAESIAALKPKFLRFPGGCIVEGRSFADMYNWKDTVGKVEERRTNRNRWQMEEYRNLGYDASDYFQSYGLGFFEYFLFCEDIGAKPIPVVNCGMTCQWHEGLLVDMDELMPYVQDVLDLIEFANGGADTKWGGIRADMGHPEPFGLEYIGIGNEQWGEEYFRRYEVFERIIGERHPEIKLITSAGWKDRGREYDLAYEWMRNNKDKAYAVDEHFYKEPEWFLRNTDRYDGYDRTLPKVFIGEWAAHVGAERGSRIDERQNTWYAALCEAAFLTGTEKNADHVVMTCYAPLLARAGHNQWQPDLIWFDNERVYETPSYHIQKLFAENTGEYAVGAESGEGVFCAASVRGDALFVKLVNIGDSDTTVRLLTDTSAAERCKVTVIKAAAEPPVYGIEPVEISVEQDAVSEAVTLPAMSAAAVEIRLGS